MSRSVLPRVLLSRWAGGVARSPLSRALIPWFAWQYGVNRGEAAAMKGGYRSLQQFFTRGLAPGARPLDPEPGALLSPVDGRAGQCGRIEHSGQLLQAKGHNYSLAALLGDEAAAVALRGGAYATLYLAPGDYHRVHAPVGGCVRQAEFIPGELWPVYARAVRRVPQLFARNQRLITWMDSDSGRVAVVMIGACLVGGIRVNYDVRWNAGPGPHPRSARYYDPPVELARGQELGRFEFGSTVIVVTPAGAALELCVAPGERVRMGQRLMWRAGAAAAPRLAEY